MVQFISVHALSNSYTKKTLPSYNSTHLLQIGTFLSRHSVWHITVHRPTSRCLHSAVRYETQTRLAVEIGQRRAHHPLTVSSQAKTQSSRSHHTETSAHPWMKISPWYADCSCWVCGCCCSHREKRVVAGCRWRWSGFLRGCRRIQDAQQTLGCQGLCLSLSLLCFSVFVSLMFRTSVLEPHLHLQQNSGMPTF